MDQTDILPTEVVFSIKQLPTLGHVAKLINDSSGMASQLESINSFTQNDINLGTILYLAGLAEGRDMFTVDISNGFTTVKDLRVKVDIMPELIPIQVVNPTVNEGENVTLTEEMLNITHPFYRANNTEFIIEVKPEHGQIRCLDCYEEEPYTFTWEQVSKFILPLL